MKTIVFSFLLLCSILRAESFFFTLPEKPDLTSSKIEGDWLHVSVQLKRLPIPQAAGIEVVNEEGCWTVRTYVSKEPERGWFPMIKLDDRIIQVSTVTRMGGKYSSCFEIKAATKEEAVLTAHSLSKLLKLPKDRVVFEFEAEGE